MGLFYSDAGLRAYFAKECLRMTNAQCWKRFPTHHALIHDPICETRELAMLSEELDRGAAAVGADGFICAFDPEFPALNPLAPKGEWPFLLFYRGELSLLKNLNHNVTVIGSTEPDEAVLARERSIVNSLASGGMTVVSGLARGCDTEAHRACLEAGGKTVAILPTQIDKLYPAQNRPLAEEIVQKGGLLLTEYANEAAGRHEAVKRFTDRDRLQALFAKAVILIASHRRGAGDSGSRHAMASAKRYKIAQYVMFDWDRDADCPLFGMNQDLLAAGDAAVLNHGAVEKLMSWEDPKLCCFPSGEQIRLDLD